MRRKEFIRDSEQEIFNAIYDIVFHEVGGSEILNALGDWDYNVEESEFLYTVWNYDLWDDVRDVLYRYGDERVIDSVIMDFNNRF